MPPRPYYASEQAFRLYEPILLQAIQSLPNAICFTSSNRARQASTDSARCSDAISAWRCNRWDSPLSQVAALATDLRVWTYNERVYIGSKHARREFHAAREFAECHNRTFDQTGIVHYILNETKLQARERDRMSDPHTTPLAYNTRITPKPPLFPKPFPTEKVADESIILDPDLLSVAVTEDAIASPQPRALGELVEAIDSGKVTGEHSFDLEHLEQIKSLVAGRLNVAFGIRNNKIILF